MFSPCRVIRVNLTLNFKFQNDLRRYFLLKVMRNKDFMKKIKMCSSKLICYETGSVQRGRIKVVWEANFQPWSKLKSLMGALASVCWRRDSLSVLLMTHTLRHAEPMPNGTFRLKSFPIGSAVSASESRGIWCNLAFLCHTCVSYTWSTTIQPLKSPRPWLDMHADY